MGRPHQAANRKIESRGTILPFVIAIREKIDELVWFPCLLEHLRHHVIDLRVTAAASLIRKRPRIADTGQHESMLDPWNNLFMRGKPGDRPDSTRNKQKPIGIPPILLDKIQCQEGRHRNPREIIVAQTRMTDMTRNQDFVS